MVSGSEGRKGWIGGSKGNQDTMGKCSCFSLRNVSFNYVGTGSPTQVFNLGKFPVFCRKQTVPPWGHQKRKSWQTWQRQVFSADPPCMPLFLHSPTLSADSSLGTIARTRWK